MAFILRNHILFDTFIVVITIEYLLLCICRPPLNSGLNPVLHKDFVDHWFLELMKDMSKFKQMRTIVLEYLVHICIGNVIL